MRSILFVAVLALVVGACADDSGDIDVRRESGDRWYRLYVPAGTPEPAPLVLVLHGFAGDPSGVRDLSDFDVVARRHGFAVAYPAAAGLIPAWRSDVLTAEPDIDFLVSVIDDVADVVDVDRTRVYAVGMSNGGGMAGRLACDAADVFAAVAVVAAAHVPGPCEPMRPVPIVAFHGAQDRIVPIDGRLPVLLPPEEWWSARASAAGCEIEGEQSVSPEVSVVQTTGCDAEFTFYRAETARHGWPGSGRSDTTQEIDASAIMGEFFARHTLESTSWSL